MLRLLLDGKCLAVLIKFHHTVFSGITHIIAENSCALFSGSYSAQYCGKALSVENIISQYQCHSVITDEIRTDDKGICQPAGLILHRIFQAHAQLAAVSQQFLKYRKVSWGGDDQYLSDICQHQC